jgi:hypothetical protein
MKPDDTVTLLHKASAAAGLNSHGAEVIRLAEMPSTGCVSTRLVAGIGC